MRQRPFPSNCFLKIGRCASHVCRKNNCWEVCFLWCPCRNFVIITGLELREHSTPGEYIWDTLFLGDINTGSWPSRLGESQMRHGLGATRTSQCMHCKLQTGPLIKEEGEASNCQTKENWKYGNGPQNEYNTKMNSGRLAVVRKKKSNFNFNFGRVTQCPRVLLGYPVPGRN
jgi:hypothetical protein